MAFQRSRKDLVKLIQRLLAKAESTKFPEEAEAFQAQAERLILRHAITPHEIGEKVEISTSESFTEMLVHTTGAYKIEHRVGLTDVLEEFRTCCIRFNRRTHVVKIIGLESDVRLLYALAYALQSQSLWAMRSWWKTVAADYSALSSYERLCERQDYISSFYSAVSSRVKHMVREEVPESSKDELILLNKQQNAEHYAIKAFGKARLVDSFPKRGFSLHGWNAGMKANLNTTVLGNKGKKTIQ